MNNITTTKIQSLELTEEEVRLLKHIFDSNFQGKCDMRQFGVLKSLSEKIDNFCR